MADVQPERGTVPLAYALIEAMMRDKARSLVDRIWTWVARNTYGRRPGKKEPRRKVCVFTWTKIAEAINADRGEVSRVGRWMVETNRLHITPDGKIGIQKDFDQWLSSGKGGKRPQGNPHGGNAHPKRGDVPRSAVGDSHATSNAREILAVKNPNRGVLPDRPPTNGEGTLPNGLTDNVVNRINFGHPAFDPAKLPEWNRINFEVQRRWLIDWDENCDIRVQKLIVKNYAGENGP